MHLCACIFTDWPTMKARGDPKLVELREEVEKISKMLDEATRNTDMFRFELQQLSKSNHREINKLVRMRRRIQQKHSCNTNKTIDEVQAISRKIKDLKDQIYVSRTKYIKSKNHQKNLEKRHSYFRYLLHSRLRYLKDRAKPQYVDIDLSHLDNHENIEIDQKPNGTVHVYFGGEFGPLSDGHGHYVYNSKGELVYRRDPFTPRGRQNHLGPYNEGLEGGFDRPQYGFINSQPYSIALGWGTRKGYCLVAKGHYKSDAFREHPHLVIYGPGEGPLNDDTFEFGEPKFE